ncbi:MAG TPA: molecular chaperone DnaJ, partial [Aggregicoccus sp.]|nr:molecular chaperone DnaJ [Aggregicoccus sp.]
MPSSQVAEALYAVHKSRATGALTLRAAGREARLLVRDGDLVGAQLGFGHQCVAQALLQAGQLSSLQLDALWARGSAGSADEELLEQLAVTADEIAQAQALAHVRRLSRLAEHAEFEPGEVERAFGPISSTRVVRAALDAGEASPPRLYRCVDLEGCLPWTQDDAERALLEGLVELQRVAPLPAEHAVLLRLLEREGLVESVSVEEWEAREAARLAELQRLEVEALRLAEEELRAAAAFEEQARLEA